LIVWLYGKRHKIGFYYLLDIVVPGVVLGQAIGRIGCLFSGCCYGIETSGTWGVVTRFAPGLRHPYQLYESAADFLIFFLLLRLFGYGQGQPRRQTFRSLCHGLLDGPVLPRVLPRQ